MARVGDDDVGDVVPDERERVSDQPGDAQNRHSEPTDQALGVLGDGLVKGAVELEAGSQRVVAAG